MVKTILALIVLSITGLLASPSFAYYANVNGRVEWLGGSGSTTYVDYADDNWVDGVDDVMGHIAATGYADLVGGKIGLKAYYNDNQGYSVANAYIHDSFHFSDALNPGATGLIPDLYLSVAYSGSFTNVGTFSLRVRQDANNAYHEIFVGSVDEESPSSTGVWNIPLVTEFGSFKDLFFIFEADAYGIAETDFLNTAELTFFSLDPDISLCVSSPGGYVFNSNPVPLPGTIGMIGWGLLGLLGLRRSTQPSG